jgi:hypothetical protein
MNEGAVGFYLLPRNRVPTRMPFWIFEKKLLHESEKNIYVEFLFSREIANASMKLQKDS